MGDEISVAAKIPRGLLGKLLPYLLALLLGAGGVGVGQVFSPGEARVEAAAPAEAVDHEARARVGVLEATVREQNAAVMRELAGMREDVKDLARTVRQLKR